MNFEQLADVIRNFEERIPFNRLLGIELERFGADAVVASFAHREELIGNFARGNLHGGAISASLDLVGGLAALAAGIAEEGLEDLSDAERWFGGFGTIDLRVDYLRPGMGEEFTATGKPLRVGKRVAVTRMELVDDQDRLVAVGTGTYILPG